MSNVLVRISGTLDYSEEWCERAVGRPDDGSDAWYEAACEAAAAHAREETDLNMLTASGFDAEVV